MKTIRWLSVALLPTLVACGCQNMSNTDKGVLAGGGIGAATGAVIGSATRHTGAGALIGGAVGALSGGLVGNAVDQSEQKTQAQIAAVSAQQGPAHGPLGLTDVVQMAQSHISDDVILSKIRTSGTVYNLSVADINYLKANGVSDAVVVEMNTTATRVPRRVYAAQPVYVVEPQPPMRLGFGVGYTRFH